MTETTSYCGQPAALPFFGFLRCGEFTAPSPTSYNPNCHLPLSDVAIDNTPAHSLVQVTIKQSKTDPFREGVTVCLARTNKEFGPVLALLPYLALRGSRPGPLFILRDQSYLTRPRFASLLRNTLRQAGIDDTKYATHSFRSGAASTAAEAGIPDVHIKMLGRWKSDAYQLYVKTPPIKLAPLTRQLVSRLT